MAKAPALTEAKMLAFEKRLGIEAKPTRKGPLDLVASGIMPMALGSRKGKVELEFLRPVKTLILTPAQANALAEKLGFHAIGANVYRDSDKPTQMQFKFKL